MTGRHLHTVPPSPSPRSSTDQLLSEEDARERHARLAAQLEPVRHNALIEAAIRYADDWVEPSPYRELGPDVVGHAAHFQVGEISRYLLDAHLVDAGHPLRDARAEIPRAIGLLLVLDAALARVEDRGV